jgi:hypothetical protein
MFTLEIEGPDALVPEGEVETVTLESEIVVLNVYARLAANNHVILRTPDGTTLDSALQPDPWEALALAV